MVLDQNMTAQSVMDKIYRIITAVMILLGVLLAAWAVKSAWDSATVVRSPHAIHCNVGGCQSILDDGSLADDDVARPKSPRR